MKRWITNEAVCANVSPHNTSPRHYVVISGKQIGDPEISSNMSLEMEIGALGNRWELKGMHNEETEAMFRHAEFKQDVAEVSGEVNWTMWIRF